MRRILINSYACCPGMGSEPGMGWNWIVSLAKYCELHIVTEGEYRPQIEEWVQRPEHKSLSRNMHFYYNPVTEKVRKMCWNQGDWRFYYYYKKWQNKTANIARIICQKESIEVLHQLNMIGFREPGYLWQVSKETGIPFVWGPVGGLKVFPMQYAKDAPIRMRCFLWLKNLLTAWQLKYDKRVDEALRQSSVLIASIPDSYKAIKKNKGIDSIIIPETSTSVHQDFPKDVNRFQKQTMTILWVGKFDFRKRLDMAIAIIGNLKKKHGKIILKVMGSGSDSQQRSARMLATRNDVEQNIQWMGNCPNSQVKEEMQKADLFLFTSVNEDTSTVVLEAISNFLPVMCFDTCGMSEVITDDVGVKIPLTTPEQSLKDFANQIDYLYHHRERLIEMSGNCLRRAKELSWDNKAKRMVHLYQGICKNAGNPHS